MVDEGPLPDAIARIVSVVHTEPHAVLGPHESPGGLTIRAFRPDALSIRVLPDDADRPPIELRKVHGLGVFEALVPGATSPFRYRLEVRYATGVFTVRDPYAFSSTLGELDLHLAAEGTHRELYRYLGAHVREHEGITGTAFAVWAPAARRVSVVGNFNQWDGRLGAMRRMGSGVWELFLPEVGEGALYKFEIATHQGPVVLKSDPFARAMELRPDTASKVTVRHHEFRDQAWVAARSSTNAHEKPISIYEVHLASWKRVPRASHEPSANKGLDEPTRWMTYAELGEELLDYVVRMGFTHVELLPVMEHPYDGSWGYQVSSYFAPTARHGTPDELRAFIDRCHARGIGVLLDWPPAHFPKDAFALGRFDGTALYEHLDPRKGEHKQWNTYVFNYGRPEVKNFLIACALYWLDEFHVDGLRVDAVASMLYLDYGADHPGQWVPNKHGGRENLEAMEFIRELNDAVRARFPGSLIVAEESTSWPGVTRPTYAGGLGFDLKWNMGWMHDTLAYFQMDPIFRTFHHAKVTFGMMYAYSERFLLPLSHDEVVHLKKSLLSKMPGDPWKQHASLRALYAYMWAHPGKKLLFMGGEIGQLHEWRFASELDWYLLERPEHRGVQQLVKDLNALYAKSPALHELDDSPSGFTWIDPNDAGQSVASFVRYAKEPLEVSVSKQQSDQPAEPPPATEGAAPAAPAEGLPPPTRFARRGAHVVFVGNFTPLPRYDYRIGVPRRCRYLERLNTDAKEYGGSGLGNYGVVAFEDVPSHGFPQSIVLTLPPLAGLYLVPEREDDEPATAR
jgi:1,4-alpha-glucan branching enzyme